MVKAFTLVIAIAAIIVAVNHALEATAGDQNMAQQHQLLQQSIEAKLLSENKKESSATHVGAKGHSKKKLAALKRHRVRKRKLGGRGASKAMAAAEQNVEAPAAPPTGTAHIPDTTAAAVETFSKETSGDTIKAPGPDLSSGASYGPQRKSRGDLPVATLAEVLEGTAITRGKKVKKKGKRTSLGRRGGGSNGGALMTSGSFTMMAGGGGGPF